MENSLCMNAVGQLICDSNGYPIRECRCGNVICGRFDSSQPFLTTWGNFWTNCTTELLATMTDADRQAPRAIGVMEKSMNPWPYSFMRW